MINAVTNQYRVNYHKNSYEAQKNTDKFTTTASNELQADTILSILHLETGESIGIYYSDKSTAENPIIIAKVKNSTGGIQEIEVYPDKVNPNNASYVEMAALSAHLKQQGKINGQAGALVTMVFNARVKEGNGNNIYAKCNFAFETQGALHDMLKNGQTETYLRYLKEATLYTDLYKTILKTEENDEQKKSPQKTISTADEKHINQELECDANNKSNVNEEDVQTEIFVNAEGERVLAIKTSFGVRYLKIGEAQDFLLGDVSSDVSIE
jgi:hypothetical protein